MLWKHLWPTEISYLWTIVFSLNSVIITLWFSQTALGVPRLSLTFPNSAEKTLSPLTFPDHVYEPCQLRTLILVIQVWLPLVRIQYIFAFQIWYFELCMKKLMKDRWKALFSFLFFLAFSQLSLSWKFELINFSFSFWKVSSLLCHYFFEGK